MAYLEKFKTARKAEHNRFFYSFLIFLMMYYGDVFSENWNPQEKLKHILPEGEDTVKGYSKVGRVYNMYSLASDLVWQSH